MNTNQYPYVFWDWNGTIIDDLEINLSIINTLLDDRKIPNISLPEYRNTFTFPIKEFYRRVGFPTNGAEYEQLVHDYWELYKRKSNSIPLMTGALDILKALKKNQIKHYILSASDRKMVIDQISTYGIQNLFEDIIAPQDGYALGKIELAKHLMSVKNIPPSDVIMIGDTFHDFETAKAINIDCALVNMGHQNLNNLSHEPSMLIFNNIFELSNAIFAL